MLFSEQLQGSYKIMLRTMSYFFGSWSWNLQIVKCTKSYLQWCNNHYFILHFCRLHFYYHYYFFIFFGGGLCYFIVLPFSLFGLLYGCILLVVVFLPMILPEISIVHWLKIGPYQKFHTDPSLKFDFSIQPINPNHRKLI